jgi:hypothetical protein
MDYLMERATEEATKACFEDRELLRQSQEVEELPDEHKVVVKKLLDAFPHQEAGPETRGAVAGVALIQVGGV